MVLDQLRLHGQRHFDDVPILDRHRVPRTPLVAQSLLRQIGRLEQPADGREVAVGGGAEKVRMPRLPALKRGAASDVTANASVSATAASAITERNRTRIVCPS